MSTVLARRSYVEVPIATDDEVLDQLICDPTVPQFQRSFESTTNINQSSSSTPVLTGASPTNAASDADVLVKADEHWVNSKWRPAMGWMYMTVCIFDFILFPILWSILQALSKGQVTNQWQPLTLQGAGLFHIAMGAVLGVAAYGRTKEKVAGSN